MKFALALLLTAIAAPAAFAAVMVDGNIAPTELAAPSEYNLGLPDLSDQPLAEFVGTGLDIAGLCFAQTPSDLYVGLLTAAPIDIDGDPTSSTGTTKVRIDFNDALAQGVYSLRVTLAGVQPIAFQLYENQAGVWQPIPSPGAVVALGDSLEISVPTALLPNLPVNAAFDAHINGTGAWANDRLDGVTPEPGTAVMMAIVGLPLMLRRLRRTARA